jgi:hypothetical protein
MSPGAIKSVSRPLLQRCNETKDDEGSQFQNCKGDKESLRGKYGG